MRKLKNWLIHALGGYTHHEVLEQAMRIAELIHIREMDKGGRKDV